ncbi:hypothetical protein A2U01_0055401, partial [Trifolium medium]|nr:hypothetical protein [Trifolium medium]
PLNKAAGIKALSSKAIQTQPQGLRRIRRRCRSGGRPGALRPADLNRPGKIRESKSRRTPIQPETKNMRV